MPDYNRAKFHCPRIILSEIRRGGGGGHFEPRASYLHTRTGLSEEKAPWCRGCANVYRCFLVHHARRMGPVCLLDAVKTQITVNFNHGKYAQFPT